MRPIRSLGAIALLLACERPLSGQHAQEYSSSLSALESVAPRSDSVAHVLGVLRDAMSSNFTSTAGGSPC